MYEFSPIKCGEVDSDIYSIVKKFENMSECMPKVNVRKSWVRFEVKK